MILKMEIWTRNNRCWSDKESNLSRTWSKTLPWYPQKDNSKIISAADQGSQTMLLVVTQKNVWNSKGKNDRLDLMIYSTAE